MHARITVLKIKYITNREVFMEKNIYKFMFCYKSSFFKLD